MKTEHTKALLDVTHRLLANGPRRYLKYQVCPLCQGPRVKDALIKNRSGGIRKFEHGELCPIELADKVFAKIQEDTSHE